MDFKKYYMDQAGGQYTVFRGADRQRGYGLGGMFKSLFKYIVPLFKTHAVPVLKKSAQFVGSEAVKAATNIANDAIRGDDVVKSFKQHSSRALDNISNEAQSKLQSQSGSGYKKTKKRKKQTKKSANHSNKKKKRNITDIFSLKK